MLQSYLFIYFSQSPLNDSMKRTHLWARRPNMWGWRTCERHQQKLARTVKGRTLSSNWQRQNASWSSASNMWLNLVSIRECGKHWHLISCCHLDSKSQKTEILNNFWYIHYVVNTEVQVRIWIILLLFWKHKGTTYTQSGVLPPLQSQENESFCSV